MSGKIRDHSHSQSHTCTARSPEGVALNNVSCSRRRSSTHLLEIQGTARKRNVVHDTCDAGHICTCVNSYCMVVGDCLFSFNYLLLSFLFVFLCHLFLFLSVLFSFVKETSVVSKLCVCFCCYACPVFALFFFIMCDQLDQSILRGLTGMIFKWCRTWEKGRVKLADYPNKDGIFVSCS